MPSKQTMNRSDTMAGNVRAALYFVKQRKPQTILKFAYFLNHQFARDNIPFSNMKLASYSIFLLAAVYFQKVCRPTTQKGDVKMEDSAPVSFFQATSLLRQSELPQETLG